VAELALRTRLALQLQRVVVATLAPLWAPALAVGMRLVLRWRIEGAREARAEYARIRATSRAPLLVCANHLTMVDSAIIAWALGSPGWYLLHPSSLPWNVPDRANFASRWWQRILVYLMKCIPIPRGGDRAEVAGVLHRLAWLLARGDVGLVFPEGGRSRTGRVERATSTYGVGRILGLVPGCRVLCVHLRGEGQEAFSRAPRRGERFHVALELFEPKSDATGLRRSLDLTRQVIGRLADLEQGFFDARR
jgi:1-acyl-sn-glycerol-3-phosphate acyltransferase